MQVSTVGLAAIILLILLFMKIPVFVSLLSASVTYFMLTPNIPQLIIAQRVCSGIQSNPLLAIPFFVCSGVFMNYTGVTQRIMDFCSVVTRRMAGGLAQVNVLLSTIMGGLSGSSMADAAMQSKILVPQMEKKGYSKEFSTVVTATSSMITPLIPPGIGMIVYGSIAGVSIGKLFVAGIGPGLLLCVTLMLLVSYISKKRGYEVHRTEDEISITFWQALKNAFLPLCLPVIIIGGIRIGVFTPTEAGSVAVFYALLLGLFYHELRWEHIIEGLKETALTTASIMLIVGSASAFAWVLTKEKIPQTITAFILQVISNKYVFLIIINLMLLFVGMFIEGNAATIILVPILAPIAASYGINEIQFAMVVIFNMALGALSPPVGVLMFITCGITKCKIQKFMREAVPFYILGVVCLFLLTFIQPFTTFFVDLIY